MQAGLGQYFRQGYSQRRSFGAQGPYAGRELPGVGPYAGERLSNDQTFASRQGRNRSPASRQGQGSFAERGFPSSITFASRQGAHLTINAENRAVASSGPQAPNNRSWASRQGSYTSSRVSGERSSSSGHSSLHGVPSFVDGRRSEDTVAYSDGTSSLSRRRDRGLYASTGRSLTTLATNRGRTEPSFADRSCARVSLSSESESSPFRYDLGGEDGLPNKAQDRFDISVDRKQRAEERSSQESLDTATAGSQQEMNRHVHRICRSAVQSSVGGDYRSTSSTTRTNLTDVRGVAGGRSSFDSVGFANNERVFPNNISEIPFIAPRDCSTFFAKIYEDSKNNPGCRDSKISLNFNIDYMSLSPDLKNKASDFIRHIHLFDRNKTAPG